MPKGDNVYQRKDGRWEARYIKERDPSGQVKLGYCYGASRAEALARARAARCPDGLLVAQFLDEWLEEQKSSLIKESTLESYRTVADKYIKPRLGDRGLDELDRHTLEQFKQELLEKDGLSASRVQTVLLVLRAMLRYAGQDCPPSSEAALSGPGRPPQKVRVLTEQERERLVTCLQLGMDECKFGILLALFTGLRVGELCSLRWEDISIPDRTLRVTLTMQRVRQPGGGTRVVVSRPSSAASVRTIPLTERVVSLCERMYSGDPKAYVMTGTRQYMEPRVAQYKLKRYADICELEGVSFRTLRDTFTSLCVQAGLDPANLCEILGYVNLRSIPTSLLHTTSDRKRAGIRLLEDAGL